MNKKQLAAALGVSLNTMSDMLSRHGAAFPALRRGRNGQAYAFAPREVLAYMRRCGDHRSEVLAAKLPPTFERPGEIVLRVGITSPATDARLWAERFAELQVAVLDDIDTLFLSSEVLNAVGELADEGDLQMRTAVRETLVKAGVSASTVKAVDTKLRRARKAFDKATAAYFTPTSQPAPDVAEADGAVNGKKPHGA